MTGKQKAATAAVGVGVALLILFLSLPAKADDLPDVDDPDLPPKPDTPCPDGFHYVLQRKSGEPLAWECVADDPTGPGEKPKCGEGKKAVLVGGAWTCVVVEAPECDDDEFLSWNDRRERWDCLKKSDPADIVVDDIDDVIKDFPEGNAIYQSRKGDHFLGTDFKLSGNRNFSIVYGLVRRECFLAAKEHGGLSDAEAMAWAKEVAARPNVRTTVLNVILCSEFNDTAYGTWGYCGTKAIDAGKCPASMRNHPGPHGRAIRLLQQHADNIARMKNGKAAARVVSIGSSGSAGDASSTTVGGAPGGHFPAMWMPGFNRQVIWTSGGNTWTTEGVAHADGTSTMNPPHEFYMARGGVEDFTNLPAGIDFGCEG